eukprot:1377011-Prymnesium_polylepis.1
MGDQQQKRIVGSLALAFRRGLHTLGPRGAQGSAAYVELKGFAGSWSERAGTPLARSVGQALRRLVQALAVGRHVGRAETRGTKHRRRSVVGFGSSVVCYTRLACRAAATRANGCH